MRCWRKSRRSKKISPPIRRYPALKAKADALAAQIAAEEKTLAGSREAVADKVSAYERLMLLRSLADASLAAATASLDSARADARRQHVFVEEIVAPNLPDEPTEPQRLRAVGTVFAVSMRGARRCSGWSRSASRSTEIERGPPDGDRHDGDRREASGAAQNSVAIATEVGPVVAEVELKPLAIPGELPPSPTEAAIAEPAVGFWGRHRLFIGVVVLPMLIAAVYLIPIAAPRYSSSASFIVRSTTLQSQDPLATLAQQSGQTIASDETYAVNAYLTSRDVVDLLAKNNELRAILNSSGGRLPVPLPDVLVAGRQRVPLPTLPVDGERLRRSRHQHKHDRGECVRARKTRRR